MPVSRPPLTRDQWMEVHTKLVRALKGEKGVGIPDGQTNYRCSTCQDTAFVVEKRFDGITTSRRCHECKSRVDAEIKAKNKYNAFAEDIPDDPPPPPKDWKRLAGLD